MSRERLAELGFRIVIFPVGALLAAAHAVRGLLASIRATGTPAQAMGGIVGFGDFLELIGLPEIRRLEQRFAVPADEHPQEG